MIFTNVSDDRMVKLDAKDLEGVIRIFNELREKACWFINEKTEQRPMPADTCEVSFTETEIVWNYEINKSCHCHPEMHKEEKRFPLKDFQQWLTVRDDEFYIGEETTVTI